MPIIIRISVEHDDRVGAAEHQKILAILGVGQPVAEETSGWGRLRSGSLVDVLRAPGGPDPVQHDA